MTGVPHRLILDSDIGSDIDDEFTLAMIWGSPELDLLGLSASYGDTVLRTRIARRMAELVGRGLRVEPGDSATRSGREIWWAGHEGDAYGDLTGFAVEQSTEGGPSRGAALIGELATGEPRSHLLAIGPLATVASALDEDAGLADRIEHLWIMGGDFATAAAEHNILSDVDAAQRVLSAGIPTTLVPVDITTRVHLHEPDVARIEQTGELGRLLAVQARAWMRRWDEDYEIPHDPLTLLALLRPDLFEFTGPGTVVVSDGTDGQEVGCTRFIPGAGSVRLVTGVDVEGAAREIADRIVAGLAPIGSGGAPA
ncbi:nucleoside hydrolase [Amnibacterium flavum]|uniref:Nucleoside hydrolase n=1 Tax=Amnibacterium flavum TaxID=2173173 RepID=A0A2V1HL90_9MICO|nr:nucleoside hydrolase [Amnibacterium flavum]PVZ93393.1 nucleoside hydrolase [Amnibacterium flavum]